jgi:hypothetical protein
LHSNAFVYQKPTVMREVGYGTYNPFIASAVVKLLVVY